VTSIGAHWAGGLPFYASMPEVRKLFDGNVYVDTAASSLLYDAGIYERVAGLIGAERILFGSDFPLLSQKRSRRRIEESGLDAAAKALILGENAARLLGLPS
jgi:predicted TIM-barrel fold metal-dependent hydrolase